MKNSTIELLKSRASKRQFTGEAVKSSDLQTIIEVSQRSATSINGQQITLIYTQDKNMIQKIAKLCGEQPQVASADVFFLFVVDFNRTLIATEMMEKSQKITDSLEGFTVGAVDAGIMLATLQTAAISLGYGTTAIGAVRAQPEAFIDLFNLPKYTFPIVGSTIGVATKESSNAPLKPRIPIESFAFNGEYNNNAVIKGVKEYDKEFRTFRDKTGTKDLPSYCETVSNYYDKIYFQILKSAQKQGFKFDS